MGGTRIVPLIAQTGQHEPFTIGKVLNMSQERILRRDEVERRCSVARSTIYAWMCKGQFPRQVKLGARAVGWRESDIDRWIEQCPPMDGDGDA